ncbi:MAG: polysaccharide deacetylase family protein, partial [Blautia glucerasea]|nr:polysaccharide deacetylase family protein [Blautia glucerasea]
EATPTPEVTEELTPIPDPAAAAEAERIQQVLAQAENCAVQYDYDQAISLLQNDAAYGNSPDMQQAAAGYQQTKDACVAWSPEQVTHIFYHSLIVDPSKAFDGDYKQGGYDQVMTTMSEFNQITQTMYDKGYVMVSIYDLAQMDENGVMQGKEVHLPEGKIPFVLSQDDVCYYHSQDGDGIATKLVVDGDGRVRNEYVEDDGSISVGDYDVVPLIDRFVEAHPDFSYHGAKGIVALTGYNGILGYRTDISYQTRPDDLNDDKKAWLDAHPDFNLDTERAGAKAVADAMKAEGWIFASHTWGHKNMSSVSMERLVTDTQNFKENVDPLIGGTDIIIFAFGADINDGGDYTGDEKFEYLKSQGYNYYCNVDSSRYFVQIRDGYFRMGRRNVDGYRMYYNPEMLSDLFDASAVFDPSRPTPVPPMG